MTPEEMDRLLAQSAERALPGGDEAAVRRAEASILADLRPVRPIGPAWRWTLAFAAIMAAASLVSAALLGMRGWAALVPIQRAAIFSTLLGSAWLAALACSRQMRPAGGRDLGPAALGTGSMLLAAVFGLAFQGYGLEHFVQEGIPCLRAGLGVAIPTGIAVAVLLRRGFVLDWSAAGLAGGALAGLAGIGMLELHCPNLKAIHVMVWHVAVMVTSSGLGWIAGRVYSRPRPV